MDSQLGPDAYDRLIADLARRQHGVVEHDQLRAFGLSEEAIQWRVEHGRLHRLHRGVYAVGHTKLTAAGRRLAAVLACGHNALLSHETAADLWGIRPNASPKIHVSIPTRAGRKRPGIVIHRPRTLRATDQAQRDGIPVTTVARTLIDLTSRLDTPSLRKTVERSAALNLLDVKELRGRAPKKLDKAIEDADLGDIRSPLESDILALCKRHGIPRPQTNALIEGLQVDFFWPDHDLVVEFDGWRTHGTKRPFETDRRRDVKLTIAGYTVARFTHDAVNDDENAVVSDVRQLQRNPRRRK